jgi:hypothetical protein
MPKVFCLEWVDYRPSELLEMMTGNTYRTETREKQK